MMMVKEEWRVTRMIKTVSPAETVPEVRAAPWTTGKTRGVIHRHRAATADHGVAARKSSMPREASRGSAAATLPPRR